MIESAIESFKIGKCPVCGESHILNIRVYRDILENDINKDVRVPIMKNVMVDIKCPTTDSLFDMDLMIQEDVYSKIVKLTNP
ncbi:MAG: hypothetical protein J6Y01_01070 [Spirochaetales bacterium]|nr:hypothetical protein [Spirochaetales bacterium]